MKKITAAMAILAMGVSGCSTILEVADAVASDPEIAAAMVDTTAQIVAGSTTETSPEVSSRPASVSSSGPSSTTSSTVKQGSTDDVISREYTVNCASGVSNVIPIVAPNEQCAKAMEFFAETYACNKINDFEAAAERRQSACGG